MRVRLLVTFAAAIALALALAPAAGAYVTGKTMELGLYVDENGDPEIIVNATPVGGRQALVDRCDANRENCVPVKVTQRDIVEAGPTSPGSIFVARLAAKPNGESLSTPPWRGRLAPTGVPGYSGELTAGKKLQAVAAQWIGGWGDEYDSSSVYACKTPLSKYCDKLTDWGGDGPEPGKPFLIGAAYAGWGIYVVNHRYSHDLGFAGPGYSSPVRLNPRFSEDRLSVMSSFIGPIGPQLDLHVWVPRSLHIRRGKAVIARVTCANRCNVSVNADVDEVHKDDSVWWLFAKAKIDKRGLVRMKIPNEIKRAKVYMRIFVNGATAKVARPVIRRSR